MKSSHPGLRDVFHPVFRLAADMQYEWNLQFLGELNVHVPQVTFVVFAADQIAGCMVRKGQGIGASIDLGLAKQDGRLLEFVQTAACLVWIIQGHQ